MSYCAENFSGIPLPIHFKTFQNTKAFGSLFSHLPILHFVLHILLKLNYW